jgi:hypothetical protein
LVDFNSFSEMGFHDGGTLYSSDGPAYVNIREMSGLGSLTPLSPAAERALLIHRAAYAYGRDWAREWERFLKGEIENMTTPGVPTLAAANTGENRLHMTPTARRSLIIDGAAWRPGTTSDEEIARWLTVLPAEATLQVYKI